MFRSRLFEAQVLLVSLVLAACQERTSAPTEPRSPGVTVRSAAAGAAARAGYVLTPFGWQPASHVHHLADGHVLAVEAGRLQERDAEGNLVRDLGPFVARSGDAPLYPESLTTAPGGAGARVPLDSQWITWAYWNRPSGQAIKADTAQWVVPPAPSSWDGQTIYLFNGVQSSSWILQPVLQYGYSAAGGGNYWSVACWYADGSGNFSHSSLDSVSTGDQLLGVVDSGSAGSGVSYYCAAHAPTFDIEMDLVGSVPELYQAVETLEAYELVTCSDYPNTNSTAFTPISVVTHGGYPALTWTPVNRVTDCGQHTNVVSNANPGGEVDLFYRNPPPPPLSVYVSGPNVITLKGTYTWTANPSGGTPPYSYQWAVQYDGGARYQEGTQQSQPLAVYQDTPNFWMIVAVTGGGTASDSMYVTNCIGKTTPSGTTSPNMPPPPGGCVPAAPVAAAGQ